jgi:hypothetical protein
MPKKETKAITVIEAEAACDLIRATIAKVWGIAAGPDMLDQQVEIENDLQAALVLLRGA